MHGSRPLALALWTVCVIASATVVDVAQRFAGLSRERRDLLEQVLKTEGVDAWSLPIQPRGAGVRDLPLACTQEALWFVCQIAEDNGVYNCPSAVRLTGRLDGGTLERALRQIVERHEILRTRFPVVEGRPMQEVLATAEVFFTRHDCQHLPQAERLPYALRHAIAESTRRFDLAAQPPWRMWLYTLRPEDHVLLVVFHHLVWDGWSIGVWMRELAALYVAATRGEPSPLPALPIQYADYAIFEREWMGGEAVASQIAYWRRQLANAPTLALPTDRPRKLQQTFNGGQEGIGIAADVGAALDALCHRMNVTPYMAMLAAFQAVLMRWTDQSKIVVGSPIAGRRRRELEGLVGTLANIVVMATDLSGDPTYTELVERVRGVTRGAYANQDVPFEMLVEKLGVPRDARMNPVFQVMFALHQEQLGRLELPGLLVEPLELGSQHSHFDLGVHFWRHEGGFVGSASYNRDLFDPETVQRLLGHFQTLLAAALRAPDQRLSTFPWLTEDEERWLAERSIVVETSGDDEPVEALFAARAEGTPAALAIVGGGVEMRYGELADRAREVAGRLRAIAPRVVGIALDRGAMEAVAVLGALSAGVPFVVLDLSSSAARRARAVAEIEPALLLSTRAHESAIASLGVPVLWLDEAAVDGSTADSSSRAAVEPRSLDAPAYISMASEAPRVVTRRALARRVARLRAELPMEAGEVMLAGGPAGREFFVTELCLPLICGARLVFDAPSGVAITGAHVTPSMIGARLDALSGARWIACSGGLLRPEIVETIHRRASAQVVYLYDPPEIDGMPFVSAYTSREQREAMPSGRVDGRGVQILDAIGRTLPIGVGGFFHAPGPDGARIPTHDRAMWLADGSVRVLGAAPGWVWHDGLRFHVSEVEAALLEHPAIDAAHVAPCTLAGLDTLIAYVVASDTLGAAEVEAHARPRLPSAGIPLRVVMVNALPIADDGTIDTGALAALPIVDGAAAAAWEKRIAAAPGARAVKVIARERTQAQARLHVLDLFPDLRAARAAERHTTSTAAAAASVTSTSTPRLAQSSGGSLPIPDDAPATLAAALLRTAEHRGDHGITMIEGTSAEPSFLSYRELSQRARRALAGLRAQGIRPGDRVILHVDDLARHLVAFWACVFAGATPVTVATTGAYDRKSAVVAKLHNVWTLLGRPALIASRRVVESLSTLPALFAEDGAAPASMRVLAAEDLEREAMSAEIHRADPRDVVFLQLSSGSTGVPKCIQMTHRGIIDFIHGASAANGFGPDDVNVNWLPMDHVGPILTCHIKDTYVGCHQVHLRTELVLADPLRWLDALHTYRGNFSWSPNFGYKLLNDALAGESARGRTWDLTSVKRLLNGGEQVTVPVAEELLRRAAPFGLHAGAMQPSFGMAEACTCICYANDWTPEAGVFRARKASLGGVLEEVDAGDADAITFVDLGALRPGIEVRIVDPDGHVLPERVIGVMQIRGRSTTPGYLHNDEANRETLVGDGWLSSGDLGFLREGRLTITGRQKETLVVRGANFYCYEIEDAVSAVPGVEPTFAAACAVDDPEAGSGGIALFFVPRSAGVDAELLRAVREKVSADFGVSPAYILPIDKERFPKTTSGKIQRGQLKADLVQGRFDEVIKRVDLVAGNDRTMPAWFHRPAWTRLDLPVRPARSGRGAWLLVGEGEGLADAIAARVGEGAVVRVTAGSGFARVGTRRFTLDPTSAQDHDALLAALVAESIRVDRAIHLGAYVDAGPEPASVGALNAAVVASARPLLLAQALGRRGDGVHLILAARRAPGARIPFERAPLRAMAKVIPHEWATLSCQHVELSGDDLAADAERLIGEARASLKEPDVRWIDGARHVLRLAPERPIAREPLPWKSGDLVLVTGGLGGIGAELAKHLVDTHGLVVLLLGRTPLEAGDDAGSGTAGERRRVMAALAAGGRVIYEAADVGDLEAVRAVVSRAEEHFGKPVAGAFHLAGVLHTRLFADETIESLADVVRPKLVGGWVLRQILGDRGFLVGFGSGYEFFGGAGVGAYAAASVALEALLEDDRRAGRAARFALAWSHWEELGMSRGYPLADRSIRLGYAMIDKRRGFSALEAAIRSGHGELSIGLDASRPNVRRRVIEPARGTEQLTAYVEHDAETGNVGRVSLDPPDVGSPGARSVPYEIVELPRLPRDASGAIDVAALAGVCRAPGASSESVLPRTGLERTIAAIWREVLDIDNVDVHTSFFALGGQSVLLVRVLTKLTAALEREISVIDLFRYPTVSSLASHLEKADVAPRRSIQRATERAQKQREAARQQVRMRPVSRGTK